MKTNLNNFVSPATSKGVHGNEPLKPEESIYGIGANDDVDPYGVSTNGFWEDVWDAVFCATACLGCGCGGGGSSFMEDEEDIIL